MAEKRCVYKCGAWNCGSYQFNLYKDDIDQGQLCDVHYWQTKAQRKWVGLTPDELNAIFDGMKTWSSFQITDVYFAIEAKLKEKNT